MPRPIWKGAITFGMISIPVKLYGATESKDVAFNTLHKSCKSRLKQKRWCPVDDREVTLDETTKAYEYSKDQYVEITEDDLEQMPIPSKHTIELTAFVKQDDIDPMYYEKTYYLEPEQVGLKPYALLLRALKAKQVSAIAKIALRNKESLCVLRPSETGSLMLETLFYPDEIRIQEQSMPDVLVSQPELNMAFSLIDLLEEQFDPGKYQDEYRIKLLEMIEAKRNGNEIVGLPEAAPMPKAVDLMAALKASLEAARKNKPGLAVAPDAPEEEAPPTKKKKAATAVA
jgi:DNA end-binding protein Ku